MTTIADRPITRRQRHHEALSLAAGLSPVAEPVYRFGTARSPVARVDVMDGLTIQSDDVQVWRDLADACNTAASELHAARMEWDEANER